MSLGIAFDADGGNARLLRRVTGGLRHTSGAELWQNRDGSAATLYRCRRPHRGSRGPLWWRYAGSRHPTRPSRRSAGSSGRSPTHGASRHRATKPSVGSCEGSERFGRCRASPGPSSKAGSERAHFRTRPTRRSGVVNVASRSEPRSRQSARGDPQATRRPVRRAPSDTVSLGTSGLGDLPCRRARTLRLGAPSRAGAGADQPAASGARRTPGAACVDGAADSVAS